MIKQDLRDGLKESIYFIGLALKALKFWRREPTIKQVADLIQFVESRSKYVSQRTLFGYVKTRAGTRYASLFEDRTFARSLDTSKWEIYLACLADLSIHAAASVFPDPAGENEKRQNLARRIFTEALAADGVPDVRPQGFDDVIDALDLRLPEVDWRAAVTGETVFLNSLDALVHWSPVADELKKYDVEAVRNSLRFEWKRVRDQFAEILDADAVAADQP